MASSSSSSRNVLHVLRTARLPILAQLHIEEALFRATSNNYLLINDGVESPAIVLGISGKPEALVHEDRAREMGVPMVKRFTGGGTVVVDEDSIMATVIVGGGASGFGLDCFPRQIMEWTHGLLTTATAAKAATAARKRNTFSLRENDFTIGSRKIGGNAQAISGDKFLQHTSFLWDYRDDRMALLKTPEKQPAYREQREHGGFVERLKWAVVVRRRRDGRRRGQNTGSSTTSSTGACAGQTGVPSWRSSLDDVLGVLRRYQEGGAKTCPGRGKSSSEAVYSLRGDCLANGLPH